MVHREQALHTGVLFKRGSGTDYPFGRTNWKTRYFVLTPSTLAYYTYEGGQCKGEVALTSKPTRKAKSSEQQQQHTTIEVMPADSKKTGRSASTIWRIAVNAPERRLLLAAGSEWEMNVWVEKLQLALRFARSGDPLTRQPQQQLVHRMSLPAASNAFVTEFQSVNAQRQRQSIAAIGGGGSEWSREPELWELPLTQSTLQAVATPPVSSSSSSSSVSILSPQEPGAFDQAMSTEYFGDNTFEYPDSIPIMGTLTPPPFSSSRTVPLFEHQRLSLPSAVEARVFSGGKRSNSVLSAQPPVPLIVDFQNFARSRRRLTIDGGARLRRELSQQQQGLSTDAYGAHAQHSHRARDEPLCEDEEMKEDDDDEMPSNSSVQRAVARQQGADKERRHQTRDASESKELQRARRHRFARLRKWLSFKRDSIEA